MMVEIFLIFLANIMHFFFFIIYAPSLIIQTTLYFLLVLDSLEKKLQCIWKKVFFFVEIDDNFLPFHIKRMNMVK